MKEAGIIYNPTNQPHQNQFVVYAGPQSEIAAIPIQRHTTVEDALKMYINYEHFLGAPHDHIVVKRTKTGRIVDKGTPFAAMNPPFVHGEAFILREQAIHIRDDERAQVRE